MATLYAGHRYGSPAEGTLETVEGLTADDARALHERVFLPNNAVFYAVGEFETGLLKERVRARFEGWKPGDVPEPVAAPPERVPAQRRIVIADKPEIVQTRILIAHEGISRSDDRRIAAGLLDAVLRLQRRFNFPQFNPIPAHLRLRVHAAEELEHAVVAPPDPG